MKYFRVSLQTGLVIMMLFFFLGCEQHYRYDVDYEEVVTVNAYLSSQDLFWVNLSFSENPYEMDGDSFILDAKVYLELPDKTVKEAFRDTIRDNYKWSVDQYYELDEETVFQPGEYKLTVEVPGYKTLYASDSIPEPVGITSCRFYPDTLTSNSYFLLNLIDPVDEENYYAVTLDVHRYDSCGIMDSIGVIDCDLHMKR